ncbi:MAG: IPT/TIG domain-containing protein [Rikenellaceae bacterium]
MNYIKVLLVGALCTLFASCNEDVYVATVTIEDPIITDFEPKSGEVGTEVTIYGENLHIIKSVTIGGGDAPIIYRISENQLVVEVSTDTRSGEIEVINNFDTVATFNESTFEVTYPQNIATPTVDYPSTENAPIEGTSDAEDGHWGESGQMLVFEGSDLHFIDEVQFVVTEDGVETPYVGTMITQREDEIVAEIPLLDVSSDVSLRLTYFNGTSDPYVDMGTFHVIVIVPTITDINLGGVLTPIDDITDAITLEKYSSSTEGMTSVTLIGFNMNLFNSFTVVSEDDETNFITLRIITQSSTSVLLDVATNFFEESFEGTLCGVYNTDKTLESIVDVKLVADPSEPRFTITKGLKMSGRSDTSGGEDKAFLDFEKAIVYSACQVYDVQADIDVMFYDQTGYLQLYNASSTTSTLKNYKCDGTSLTTTWADWASFWANTTQFRTLDQSGDSTGHVELIEAYKAIGTDAATIVEFNAAYIEETLGISTPSTNSPKIYESVDTAYNSGTACPYNDNKYLLVYSSTSEKYGLIELQSMVIDSSSGMGQSVTFDLLWSL